MFKGGSFSGRCIDFAWKMAEFKGVGRSVER